MEQKKKKTSAARSSASSGKKRTHAAPEYDAYDEVTGDVYDDYAESDGDYDDYPEEKPRTKKKTAVKSGKKKKKKKKSHGWIIPVVIVGVLLIAVCVGFGWVASQADRDQTIRSGVTAFGVDLSGMTREEAKAALTELGHEKYDDFKVTADLPLDNTLTISAADAGLSYTITDAVNQACRYGHDGNLFSDAVTYLQSRYLGKTGFTYEGDMDVQVNEDAIRSILSGKAQSINDQLLENAVEVDLDKGEIRMTKGASSLYIDEDLLTQNFIDAFLNGGSTEFTYESAPVADDEYDFQALYDDLHAERVDAEIVYKNYYIVGDPPSDDEPGETTVVPNEDAADIDFGDKPYIVTQSSTGVDFDVAEARRLWDAAGYGEQVVIPLTVDKPETTTEELESTLLADNLSKNWTMVKLWGNDYCEEVRTSLSGSTSDRISNVKKACSLLNGVILCPGEVFSYNDTLGERTEANGWKPATAYANGEVRQEYGGGICQVSSTLYNAVLYSNLEIIERECHQFQVGYLPWGMDATVSWGWPDFKFRNNTDYPIEIVAWVDEDTNQCCVQIKGTDVDHVYVIMRFNNWETFDTTGTYHDADGNPLSTGMAAATWRLLYHDGDDYNTATPISEEYEAYSTYHYHTEDIEERNVPLASGGGDTTSTDEG